VHRFGGEGVERHTVARQGETLAHLYGFSYPVKEVRENVLPRFPRHGEGPLGIGVLHANVGGNPDYDNYAPCSLEDLVACRLDYWALGHIHARQVLRAGEPWIVYPGNTQGRSLKEAGPRGCYLVRVDETGIHPEFVATDVVRWFHREVDLAPLSTWDGLLDLLWAQREEVRHLAEGRAVILRLSLTGRGELHRQLRRPDLDRDLADTLREGETDRPDFVWVESVQNRSRPTVDLAQRRQLQDFVGDFLRAAQELRQEEDPAEALLRLIRQRPEHRLIAPHLEQWNAAQWQEVLAAAETGGLDLLLPEEE